MTEEQWALVNANRRLALKVAHQFWLTALGRRLGEHADIEQEAFLGLCKAARTYQPGRAKFSTWAYLIIRRWLRVQAAWQGIIRVPSSYGNEKYRAMGRQAAAVEECDPETIPTDEPADKRLMEEDAWRLLRRLPQREQTIIHLRFVDGLTLAEIGRRLGITRERVRQLIREALRKLRIGLEGGSDDPT